MAYGLAMTPAATTMQAAPGRLDAAVAAFAAARQRAAQRRHMIDELESLDDHVLADIGLRRDDIAEAVDRVVGPKGPSLAAIAAEAGLGLAQTLGNALTGWYRRQRAYDELMALDDAMLRDIGVNRGEIPLIVARLSRSPEAMPIQSWRLDEELVRPIRQWNRSRQTARTLQSLDDHMLTDIGLVRGEIDEVAETMAAKSLQPANANQTSRAA
ncbi:MAG: DUF1127 domain-containing protein [Dongiaceae bacterium]